MAANCPSQELQRYRQRDLIPSHLYRLGIKLFGSEPTRHRVIDASRYVPRELVPHAENLRRTWDGRPLETAQHVRAKKPLAPQRRHSDVNLNSVETSDFTEDQYRQWIDQRKKTRDGLESMALSERWLCSKTRTTLENKLLAEMRGKRGGASLPIIASKSEEKEMFPATSSETTAKSESISRQKSLSRSRRSTLAEAETLSSHILHGRQRFVSLLTLHDPAGTGRISTEELGSVLLKMCPCISQESMELILKGLQVGEDGTIDYRPLLKGGLLQCIEKYFEMERSLIVSAVDSTTAAETEAVPTDTRCTMSGERGALATAYKDSERQQFEVLLEFCRERGIILDTQLLEKALLLPYDHSRESCLEALKQPGLDLLSRQFTAPPREQAKTVEREDYGKKFGWAYKEMKGRGKPSIIRLPKPPKQNKSEKPSDPACARKAVLKRVTVAPKVDCWLTFKEYQWITRKITSRPGFNYKYHGLPDNNAFWPGALAGKLRLWLPTEKLEDKPYSLHNIFHPVTHPRIYNPHAPHMEQRRAWPENARGYVQFGGATRKTYGLS